MIITRGVAADICQQADSRITSLAVHSSHVVYDACILHETSGTSQLHTHVLACDTGYTLWVWVSRGAQSLHMQT